MSRIKVDSFSLRTLLLAFMALPGALAIVFPSQSQAYVELNTFYFSEALSNGSSQTMSRMFIEGTLGFAIDRKGVYLVGWNYSMFTTSDVATATTAYSSTQMGPRFVMMIDKHRQWSVGLGYNLVTSATYTDGGGTSEKWKGSALKFDIGYSFELSEATMLGLRLNYSSASFIEKLASETDYSVVSYTKTHMYPSCYFIWFF